MAERYDIPTESYQVFNVVDPSLFRKMKDYQMRLAAVKSGYPVLTDWHPIIPDGWGTFPRAPMERARVYSGNEATWAYSHHQTITRFGDRFVASWSNGLRHEDYVGQEVHLAWSKDGRTWSEPQVVAPTPVESKMVRNNAGLYAANGRLFCFVGVAKDFERDVAAPGMSVLKEQHIRLDLYETTDLKAWKQYENICGNIYLFEGPRRTRGGKLLCCGFDLYDHHAMVMIWDDPLRPMDRPRLVHIPNAKNGVLPEQGTWYQTDDGRIWMYQRDGSISCRLGLVYSDDEGETWSTMARTDFPNTYSRAYAGRLTDGRYYIVGNNYDYLLDRMSLQLALSDDGRKFTRQYTLVEGPTTRRINGRHKEDGYHYPNCCCDGNRLLVIYSVNKEDIEVGVVDTAALK